MHILLTEARFGDADALALRLRDLDVRVTTCHGHAGFCRALELGARCPLDNLTDRVDLVVDVRGAGDELTTREYGVICAERSKRPAWIVGTSATALPAVPAAVRNTAIAATEGELIARCRRPR